jgi:hypothetical protein
MAKRKKTFWLVRNDGVELDVLYGPFEAYAQVELSLKDRPKSELDKEENVYHVLELGGKRPRFHEFSAGFMDELRGL